MAVLMSMGPVAGAADGTSSPSLSDIVSSLMIDVNYLQGFLRLVLLVLEPRLVTMWIPCVVISGIKPHKESLLGNNSDQVFHQKPKPRLFSVKV